MIRRLPLVIALLAGLLLVGVVGGWLYASYTTSPRSWPVEQFSASAWKSSSPEERYIFYRDLARSGRLDGATRQEEVNLLGPPSFEASEGSYMTYMVKHAEPGEWSLDSIYLLDIRFDSNTFKVREYLIRGD